MRKLLFYFLIVSGISLFSCNTGNANQSANSSADSQAVATPVAYDNSLVKGQVIDSIYCSRDKNQIYALYLPSSYSSSESFPVIYFFDAHARGALPLYLYKAIAEQYGFVLIGSDISKNGIAWEETNAGIKILMEETRKKINIDPKRIYTAGFSGGSRVASSIAIYDGGIAGVIGCAAGFPRPEQGLQNKFNYFGIVGEYDFNVHEMEQLDATLEQSGFTHGLLKFDGIHEWPSFMDFKTALLWMYAIQNKDDFTTTWLVDDVKKRIVVANSQNDWIKVHNLFGIAASVWGAEEQYKKKLGDLTGNKKYADAVTARTQLQELEAQQQQELAKQFTTQDEKWWAGKISALNKNVTTLEEKRMNRRLLSYLGFLGYSYSNRAIEAGDFAHAEAFLKIFKMVDPKNPDCPYLNAIYHAKKGETQLALASLEEAASLGYNDIGTLKAEPALAALREYPGFGKVQERMIANYKKD